ncbi:Phytochrome-like protein cph2 [Pandoraea iniqua]|uniref:sensor domain-containing diguanylate cyclase n=1 Tax=Pandoraea iniqua TaxID=2508288 RepID=UPI001242D5F4|nr:diguanylate cyclase [Pandoraea iniqua]VVD75797.1 Phytochrome-like protein cph2 [Pandoraea iniqua]
MTSPNTSPASPRKFGQRFGPLGLTLMAVGIAVVIVVGVRATLLYEGRVAVRDDAREANARVARLAARVIGDDISACTQALEALAVAGRADPNAQLVNCLGRFGHPAIADPSTGVQASTYAQAVIVNEAGEAVFEALPSATCFDRADVQQIVDAERREAAGKLTVSMATPLCPGGSGKGLLLTHGVRRADGGFAGVGIVTVDAEYFARLFAGLAPGERGIVSLLRNDGVVLSGWKPGSGSDDGEAQPSSGADGDFLYIRQPLPGVPMQIDIRAPRSEIYAEWRKRAFWVAGLTAALGAACAVLSILLRRQGRRRKQAEAALQQMASTDPLTGLANRRTLDEAYDREWRRAVRERAPLSLLFIDVDHFKTFNDRYGHPAGDDALVAVAHAISKSIRRPGDFAGRYGGEEFMVILPKTDAGGARDVAERVRTAVRATAIAHEGSEHGRVTISIGIAGTGAMPTGTPDSLLQAADEALYSAKREGRDRVYIHVSSGGDPCPAI